MTRGLLCALLIGWAASSHCFAQKEVDPSYEAARRNIGRLVMITGEKDSADADGLIYTLSNASGHTL